MKKNKLKDKAKNSLFIERGKRLKFVREMTGLSMKAFANRCNVGLTTINYWENALSSLTERGSQKVMHALRIEGIACTILWLMQGIGPKPTIVDQSKLSKLNYSLPAASTSTQVQEQALNYLENNLKKEMELFTQLEPEYLIYQIPSHNMTPLYAIGDWVAGKKLLSPHRELACGLDCIVELEKNHLMVRRIKLGARANSFSLYVTNPDYSVEFPPLLNIELYALAPIIRIWKKYPL